MDTAYVFDDTIDYFFLFYLFSISETVDHMEAFTYLTDDIIQLIINDKDKNLKQAQTILHDVMNRRLYKCVVQERCNVSFLLSSFSLTL